MLHPVGTGINYITKKLEFIQFEKYSTISQNGSFDAYQKVGSWPTGEYCEIYHYPTGDITIEILHVSNSDPLAIIELGSCSNSSDLSTFIAGEDAPGTIIKNIDATDFEIYIPDEVYTIKN